MIVDNIRNRGVYAALHKGLAEALQYLGGLTEAVENGDPPTLNGSDVYSMNQTYETEEVDGKLFESHREFIDVQYVVDGEETIRVRAVEDLTAAKPYNADNDVSFYEVVDGTDVRLSRGDFAILFPHDAHIPRLRSAGNTTVRKIVVKVRVAPGKRA